MAPSGTAARPRASTSYSSRTTRSASTSYPSNEYTTSYSRAGTSYRSTRPTTSQRPRTSASSIGGISSQQIICSVSESRGISPTVGLAFVNLSTAEAVLCQISDSQTYVRTLHKLGVFEPSEILIMSTAANPKSKLFSIIEGNLPDISIRPLDRKYWAESSGLEYIQQLAFAEDVEAIKVSIEGNYFATCCIAAVGGGAKDN
ncbi:MAG: hypothetical protein M1819_004401 [Sarea resinae]|nr:MAG: hypothetical protein M1819_004401 [Sarea resinae]